MAVWWLWPCCSGQRRCRGGAAAMPSYRCHGCAILVLWPCTLVPCRCRRGAVAARCPCVPGHGPRAARALPARCLPRRAELPQDVSPAANMTPPPPLSQGWDTPPLQAAARCPGGHSPAPHPTASTPSHSPHPAPPPGAAPSRLRLASPSHVQRRPRLHRGGGQDRCPPLPTPLPPPPPGCPHVPCPRVPRPPPSTYLMAPGAAPAWAASCPAGMAWHGSARPGAGVPRLCMVPRGAAGTAAGVAECRARDGGGVGGAAELRDNHSL